VKSLIVIRMILRRHRRGRKRNVGIAGRNISNVLELGETRLGKVDG